MKMLRELIRSWRALKGELSQLIEQQVSQLKEPPSVASLESTDCQSIADQLAAAQDLLDQAISDLNDQQAVVDSLTGLVAGLQTSLQICLEQSNP